MNTKYFKESLIGELTLTAIELVDNTDLKDINDIENSCCTIKIDDRYEVNISIDYATDADNIPVDWWIWFTLFDDGVASCVIEQDSKNLFDDKIREAATQFVDLCITHKIITAE